MADSDFIEPPPWLTPPKPAPAEPAAAEEAPSPEAVIDLPPGVMDSATHRLTQERQRTPPAKPDVVFFPTVAGPAAPPTSEVEDATVVSSSRHAMTWRIVVPGVAPVAVFGVLYLGRNPVAPPGESGARVLPLPDSAKSISKTHARLEVEAGQLYVSDLDSTNGVWIVPAGEDAIEVQPGERAAVPAGSDLELGDFVIQVEHG